MTLSYQFVTNMWTVSWLVTFFLFLFSFKGNIWPILGFYLATIALLFSGITVLTSTDASAQITETRIVVNLIAAFILSLPILMSFILGIATQASSTKASVSTQELPPLLPREE